MSPKEIKGTSSRKPPATSQNHDEIAAWLPRVMPEVQPIVAELDATIRRTIPELTYAVKWQKAYYGLAELGWIIELAAYHVSANIVFLGGADFDDPPALGSGRSRYVKIRSLEEARAPEIVRWIEESSRVPGWPWA